MIEEIVGQPPKVEPVLLRTLELQPSRNWPVLALAIVEHAYPERTIRPGTGVTQEHIRETV
jgi:hypothetical protein